MSSAHHVLTDPETGSLVEGVMPNPQYQTTSPSSAYVNVTADPMADQGLHNADAWNHQPLHEYASEPYQTSLYHLDCTMNHDSHGVCPSTYATFNEPGAETYLSGLCDDGSSTTNMWCAPNYSENPSVGRVDDAHMIECQQPYAVTESSVLPAAPIYSLGYGHPDGIPTSVQETTNALGHGEASGVNFNRFVLDALQCYDG
jgi:hypothetical protein